MILQRDRRLWLPKPRLPVERRHLVGAAKACATRSQSVSLAAAPTIEDFKGYDYGGTASDPQTFPTSGLTWSAGQTPIACTGLRSDVTTADPAGDVNDTSSLIASRLTNSASLYAHLISVDTSLDANFSFNLSTGSRLTSIFVIFAGLISQTTPVTNAGVSSGAPVCSSFTVPDGPRNFVALFLANSTGGHDANPPLAPVGATLLDVQRSGDHEPNTAFNTLALAYRIYAAGDLSWPGGTATVPAHTWQGWDDIDSNPWATFAWAILS